MATITKLYRWVFGSKYCYCYDCINYSIKHLLRYPILSEKPYPNFIKRYLGDKL